MEKVEEEKQQKPHCLILPYPIQGHLNPMLQFSKRLLHKDVTITLAATRSLLKTTTDGFSFSVEPISDGFDEGRPSNLDLQSYWDTFRRVGEESLSELLRKLADSGRPVDCMVYDPFLPWALGVAKRSGVRGAAFFTQSCSVNIVYYKVYKGEIGVPVEKETVLPGLPPLAAADMPSFVRDRETHPGSLELLVDQFQRVEEDADFVFVNSVYELEKEATDWLVQHLSVKTIGPTVPSMYLDKRLMEDKHYGFSMLEPDSSCLDWLKKHTPKSVVYVSFGSMAKLELEQMEELAQGLKMTKRPFLWVVRSSEVPKLPANFASDNWLIVSWCPQLEVLAHDAVGCFVTHCGWNSTLEALSLGVPLVGIPWWSDQSTNAKFVEDVWKMGVRARPDEKNIVRREEIVGCIERVMEGEKGEEIRNNAKKWKEMSREAVDEGGTSDKNIQEFITAICVIESPK